MSNITIDEIQRDPLKYLRQVEASEILVIFRADQAIAELSNDASFQPIWISRYN